jgi:uncharacterized protein YndB with AHSA1/START domain
LRAIVPAPLPCALAQRPLSGDGVVVSKNSIRAPTATPTTVVPSRKAAERFTCRASATGLRQNGSVAPIISTAEIALPAEDVFAYVTDPSTFPEWQQGVVRGHMNESPTRVGSQCTTVRNIGGREREVHTTITDCEPPRRWADRGIDGPIRALVEVAVEPLEGNARSRVTISLDFTGHGIGKLLVPLIIRRQAAREMPENMRRLKQQLEARA